MEYKIFGCKVNKYYTDRWLNSDYLRDKSGIFVASCVVTDNAKRKWIRFVKKEVQNLHENEKIYISGCGAFKDGKAQDDFFTLYPELHDNKGYIEVLDEEPDITLSQPLPLEGKGVVQKTQQEKIDFSKLKKLKQAQIYTKKFILIQGGCDSFCSFCLTVQKRGRHYYRSAEDIIEEILDFEKTGGKEIVLTGVNLSAWGLDSTNDTDNSRFAELLEEILKNTSIPRLRISSLGPEFIDNAVLEILQNERVYPHFHFSVQSGSSDVLKSMSRHYDGKYMKDLLLKTRNIKREDNVSISIGADIIVGFPGETEEDFMQTYNLIQDCNITKVHAFPFSAHTKGESVPAGKFKNQVPENIKKERMEKIMALAEKIRINFKKTQKGKILKVLVEKSNLSQISPTGEIQSQWSGWTENYLEADETNFKIITGTPKKNHIIIGKFI